MTPAKAAKAASDRSRPACDQLIRICAALIGPMPGSSSNHGVTAATSRSSSACNSAASSANSWMRCAVERSARTVMRCSSVSAYGGGGPRRGRLAAVCRPHRPGRPGRQPEPGGQPTLTPSRRR